MQGVLQMTLKPQTKIRILTLTSCTGEKAVDDPRHLVLEDFGRGPQYVAERENELEEMLRPAGEMYTGQQHVRLMRGVAAYRQSTAVRKSRLDLHILSAGYGIIPEDRKIAPLRACSRRSARADRSAGPARTDYQALARGQWPTATFIKTGQPHGHRQSLRKPPCRYAKSLQ